MSQKITLVENIRVTDFAAEGKSIGRFQDKVIFIENAVPGDIVDVRLFKNKKKFAEGVAISFHHLSKDRIASVCAHHGICGGCKWQNLSYEKQLAYKQAQVKDTLEKLGNVKLPALSPIIPSESTEFYRNKLEYTFSNNRWLTPEEIEEEIPLERNALGFHIPRRFDKILDIETCFLQPEPSNSIRLAIRNYALKNGLSFYDLRQQTGLLRNLIIRTTLAGEVMVILQAGEYALDKLLPALDFLAEHFPQITSLQYIINTKKNETFGDLEVHCYKGKPYITEHLEDLIFRIGPKSFYQTNSHQAHRLYETVRSLAGFTGKEIVYDLYTGTGTIANFVARQAQKVVGVEYVREAIEDAKINSKINGIHNTVFYAGDLKDLLTSTFFIQNEHPDVIITDPPRAGMHPDVVNALLNSGAEKIIYVSCNPATQARDLALLDTNYCITSVQPVDMFPHTHHVENVCLLELRR